MNTAGCATGPLGIAIAALRRFACCPEPTVHVTTELCINLAASRHSQDPQQRILCCGCCCCCNCGCLHCLCASRLLLQNHAAAVLAGERPALTALLESLWVSDTGQQAGHWLRWAQQQPPAAGSRATSRAVVSGGRRAAAAGSGMQRAVQSGRCRAVGGGR